ncbi:4-demethylwyosine synthase TYW1 [Candidatus Pacearchaeota archaeon]|nr:4-demethylwyosine synthase TYW1 [Candidatus Pacearchaeota archaeon]
MIPDNIRELLKKQHYLLVGSKNKKDQEHSAVQICRWTKNSLRDEGVCYKEKFYGIQSHRCCQMTPAVMWCPNKCVHCWRAIEHTLGEKFSEDEIKNLSSPKEIIDSCIEAQRKLLLGFNKVAKKNPFKKPTKSKANMIKWHEAQEPMQFAISLSGEPTLYPMIGDLIKELRNRGKTSFLVTNGLYPEKLKELLEKNQLPTQLYVSVNTSNKKLYDKFHRSSLGNKAWDKLNKTLELMPKLGEKTRTIFRMNLVKDLNMSDKHVKEYAELIKKSKPLFTEIKGFMSVGFARERLGYDRMPTYSEMLNFCEKLVKELGEDWKILDSHERSRAFVLGRKKNKVRLKIKSV